MIEAYYPLRFEPIFRRYLWGGNRLRQCLQKNTGDIPCAESWEIVDHHTEQSRVTNGHLKGKSLTELMHHCPAAIVGQQLSRYLSHKNIPEKLRLRFPLLLKFLDANQVLSVQVHPNDTAAMQQEAPDLGKTEAWIIMQADPGSKVYAGLVEGVTRTDFQRAIQVGRVAELLHQFEPQVGDVIFIPAGTVHALGAGLLVAEIQQASDTTFRLFDWNRLGNDGRPRELHVDRGLAVTDFTTGPVEPIRFGNLVSQSPLSCVRCDYFELQVLKLENQSVWRLPEDGMARIIAVLEGGVTAAYSDGNEAFRLGDSFLIPALCNECELRAEKESKLMVAIPLAPAAS